MTLEIAERGYWITGDAGNHMHDEGLMDALVEFFRSERTTVIDIGCGDGSYVRRLISAGIPCLGYDGNPHTPEVSKGLCFVADFTQPVSLGKFGWVLSLEVGEHIPHQHEAQFIDNLHRHSTRGIVLSWAVEGQGGDGHVNCRSNDYIKGTLKDLGYINDVEAERKLRAAISNCYWFKDTLMVFRC